jgi:hypothetical protein
MITSNASGTTGSSSSMPGTNSPAKFYFYNATYPGSTDPLEPGSPTLVKSGATGKFCRLVPQMAGSSATRLQPPAAMAKTRSSASAAAPPGQLLVMLCDVTDPAQATPMVGLAHLYSPATSALLCSCCHCPPMLLLPAATPPAIAPNSSRHPFSACIRRYTRPAA